MSNLVEAVFIKESKSRFLCTIEVDGMTEECYVPSSCKLSKLISLEGETILVKPISNKKSNLKYGLYAIKKKNDWVLLNLSEANNVLARQIHSRLFSFLGKRKELLREYTIEGYKADFYLPQSKTIIEVKTVLTDEKMGVFPSVKSDRNKRQIFQISYLLGQGYKVVYLLIALNPKTKLINISLDNDWEFETCLKNGLICKGYSLHFIDNIPTIYKKIVLKYGDEVIK